MKSDLYEKSEKLVIDSFTKAGDKDGIRHFIRAVYWTKKLKPDSDEAMHIAAVAHDIERAFRGDNEVDEVFRERGFKDQDFLNYHQSKGAEIIANFLESQGADTKLIERVKALVENHEIGGNEDQNVIKDADSISYFENNIDYFVETKAKEIGKDRVKEKFDWMYERMSSDRAKRIASKWYKDALKRLDD
jgi:hypothetical protein